MIRRSVSPPLPGRIAGSAAAAQQGAWCRTRSGIVQTPASDAERAMRLIVRACDWWRIVLTRGVE